MKTFCHENRNTQAVPAATMAQAQALVLFSSLLTICVSEGSPEVWVQVQMEATKLPSLSLSVRCGVLGTNLISLVTVIWKEFVDAQGTKLAVLHPELGTQQWVPASQAHWETSNSVSLTLTLEQSKARKSLANTTFCCEFVTFPHGSKNACGDPGLSAPTPVPFLQADLARILGTSGFLLLGFIFILYILWRQKHWCFSKSQPSPISTQAQVQAQVRLEGWCLQQGTRGSPQPASKASLATLHHHPHSAPLYEAMVHPDQHLPRCIPHPHQPTPSACLLSFSDHPPYTAASSRLRMDCMLRQGRHFPALFPTDCLEHSTLEKCSEVQ